LPVIAADACFGGLEVGVESFYTDFILKNAPRVLTQVDRDADSKTYGSCDRNHWHLKIRDFDSAILQQTGLTLALLYQLDFEGNVYYGNENVKRWAAAALEYWAKIQLRDGSFNEYYPNEHGFPPTAFTLYTACEIYLRLELDDAYIKEKIRRTARRLCGIVEEKAFNQEMASITGLYDAYRVLGESWVLEGCERKLSRILSLQSEEGWFPEYGGADLGYLSVFLDMMCEYQAMSGDGRVVEAIGKIIGFVKYFVHPNGTVGGEYGSRNTIYFLPNGLEVARLLGFEDAAAIKRKLYSDTRKYGYFMDSVDDRYFTHYVMHSFLRALEKERMSGGGTGLLLLPCESEESKYFKESGLLVVNNKTYTAVVGLRKGGTLTVFDKKEAIFVDCGYRVNLGNGTVMATNWQDPSYEVGVRGNRAEVKGKMNKIRLRVSTPVLLVGLRVAAAVAGRGIIKYLKRKLILIDKHSDIRFERRLEFGEEEIMIQDVLSGGAEYERADAMSLRHVASGKFFAANDLLARSERMCAGGGGGIALSRRFNCKTRVVEESTREEGASTK
jgi:hypothetical protein